MVTLRPYRKGGWEVDIRVTLPDGSEHRQRRRAPTAQKSAAHRWGEERERLWYQELTQPKTAQPKEVPTLAVFAARFLDGHARANKHKPSGIAQKEIALRVHLVPFLGAKTLDRISNEDVQRLKLHLMAKSAKTVNNVLTVLNTLLKKAVEWGVLPHMPCMVRLLKVPERAIRFWDYDEFERLVAAAAAVSALAEGIILLGGEAGLRAGEMRALEWSDVDLVKRQVRIERSEWRGQITATKGGRVRHVPMTMRLAEWLKRNRHLKGARVLCTEDGEPLNANQLSHRVDRAIRKAGLAVGATQTGQGPHTLRHTFCSHLAMRGVPARAIQELAGHRDLATTLRYMHLSPVALEEAIRMLDQRSPRAGFGDILETGTR